MTIAIVAGILVGLFVLLILCLWAVSDTIDKAIKHYIDYSKKGKGDGSD
jgi:hypothetical protein